MQTPENFAMSVHRGRARALAGKYSRNDRYNSISASRAVGPREIREKAVATGNDVTCERPRDDPRSSQRLNGRFAVINLLFRVEKYSFSSKYIRT